MNSTSLMPEVKTARVKLAAAAIACLSPIVSYAGAAASPDAAFASALSQAYLYNPELGAARQQLRQTDEGVPQALSGWRPHVTIEGSAGVSSVWDSMDPAHQPERRCPRNRSYP